MNAWLKGYKTSKNNRSCFRPVNLCIRYFPNILFNISHTYLCTYEYLCLRSVYTSTAKDLASRILTETWDRLIFKEILIIVKTVQLDPMICSPAASLCQRVPQSSHAAGERGFCFQLGLFTNVIRMSLCDSSNPVTFDEGAWWRLIILER